jgi:hypothetical protein
MSSSSGPSKAGAAAGAESAPNRRTVNAEAGFNFLTHTLARTVPRALAESTNARRGIRALINRGR